MFSSPKFGLISLSALGVLLFACLFPNRSSRPERLALLAFDNLTSDPSLDWVGPALREGLLVELRNSSKFRPGLFDNPRDPALARARWLLSGYLSAGPKALVIEVQLRRFENGKVEASRRVLIENLNALDRVSHQLAQWLSPEVDPARCISSSLKALAEARRSASLDSSLSILQQATDSDRGCGAVYVLWAERLRLANRIQEARAVVARARNHSDQFADIDRKQLAVLEARLEGDEAKLLYALQTLAESLPYDPKPRLELGQMFVARGRYAEAARWFREATRSDAEEPAALNQLGYAEARLGNLNGAVRALESYRRLAPTEANPLDSLGDVHYHLGRFEEAARYYEQAYQLDPSFLDGGTLYKAARARLMQADLPAARELLRRFLRLRQTSHDPSVKLLEAQSRFLIGEAETARQILKELSSNAPAPLAALAASRLGLFHLQSGHHTEAVWYAKRARQTSQAPVVSTPALLVLLAAGDPTAGGVPAGPLRDLGLALRYLMQKEFREAARLLTPLVKFADPLSEERLPVLLAWAELESGNWQQAKALLSTHGLPPAGLEPPLAFVWLPRFFELQARILEAEGRKSLAKAHWELFRQLGPHGP